MVNGLNETRAKIKQVPSPSCSVCDIKEDVFHYLLVCPKYKTPRDTLMEQMEQMGLVLSPTNLLNPKQNIKSKIDKLIVEYVAKTNVVI